MIKIENTLDDVLWIVWDDNGYKKWLIGLVYLHPERSAYYNPEVFSYMEGEIWEIERQYKIDQIVIMGDFNARIGAEQDLWTFEDNLEDNLINGINKYRVGQDKTVNKNGLLMLNFCRQLNLTILNGRTIDDCRGDFTFHKPQGDKTVDYIIISKNCKEVYVTFKVDERIESNYMPIFTTFDKNVNHPSQEEICQQRNETGVKRVSQNKKI